MTDSPFLAGDHAESAAGSRRLFIAAWPDDGFRAEVADMLDRLRRTGAPLKWVPPENVHVTLRFLGEVDALRVPELTSLLALAVRDAAPFPVQVAGLGTFPPRGAARVLWADLKKGGPELAALASAVERGLLPGGFVAGSDKPFRAHVTLGRVKGGRSQGPRGLERLTALMREWSPTGHVHTLSEVRLVESRLEPRGAVYAPVARFPLRAV